MFFNYIWLIKNKILAESTGVEPEPIFMTEAG